MSSALRVVPSAPPEVVALSQACQDLAKESALDRFEISVKGRLQVGIRNDNDLRMTDDLLHKVVIGGDVLEASVKPAISAAYALHKSLIATAKPFKERWAAMRSSLSTLIVNYNTAKEEVAQRQQEELNRAAEEDRVKKQTEARLALRRGDFAAAQAAMDEVNSLVTPVIMNATPVLDHSTERKPWQVDVTDRMAVVKAVAAGIIPLEAIDINVSYLRKEASTRGGLPEEWAGLNAWQDTKLSVFRR